MANPLIFEPASDDIIPDGIEIAKSVNGTYIRHQNGKFTFTPIPNSDHVKETFESYEECQAHHSYHSINPFL